VEFQPVRKFEFTHTGDLLGWHQQHNGKWFLGLWVEMGRIKDEGNSRLRTALKEIATRFDIEFRLSANQNMILGNVADEDRAAIEECLVKHGVKTVEQATPLHAAALGCPALPTCGLALSESERFLPGLVDRIEALCAEAGVGGREILIRMTGCPNGCARPYMAEIGFVGKAPGRYQLWLGGDPAGTRIARVWKEIVKEAEIDNELRPLFARYAAEQATGEAFGDWVSRVLWAEQAATVEGAA